ncbi:MAG: UDP-glucose/GDP-mannose dehydrogenase family protein [Micrococcales bacterium]|nr:UDP-glucose/GDP-mannose dehydrogenase family protein [Micrococcales bacterium]NBR55225.1 UDP-glucose/GDP-mannose dehydrogenase family protein [Micrococcales bacterium]NBY43319.1 UDP-glucose/GDP-mannose dehydrogenase family protein [Micrococcales bacterium]
MAMKITVIGLGYLGATHAVAMSKTGHQVIGLEKNPAKLESLKQGKAGFFEPGLDEALAVEIASGRLTFQADHDENSAAADLHFICVGTPQTKESLAADTSYLFSAIEDLAPHLKPESVVVGKSTVPVGTAAALHSRLAELTGFEPHLAWNPEFLREGTALEDSLRPDRLVVGVKDDRSEAALREVFAPMIASGIPFLVVDIPTAELVKAAANAFLATKISFINAMAEIAEVAGADASQLAEAIGYDERIGNKFLRNGVGFGGGCLPKDIRALMARAEELGVGQSVAYLKEIDNINLRRRERVVAMLEAELGNLSKKRILVLGAAFKPDSDDVRDSPALGIAMLAYAKGAEVVIHDPVALPGVSLKHPELIAEQDLVKAFSDVEAVVLATEWREYRQLDPATVVGKVANALIIDGRNVLDINSWQHAGFKVLALGKNVKGNK